MSTTKERRKFWVFPGETKLTGFPSEHIAMTKPCTPENLIAVTEFDPKTEVILSREDFDRLYDEIARGDVEHRIWLRKKLTEFFDLDISE